MYLFFKNNIKQMDFTFKVVFDGTNCQSIYWQTKSEKNIDIENGLFLPCMFLSLLKAE